MKEELSVVEATQPVIFCYGSPRQLVDFPGGANSKESVCNAEDLGSVSGLGKSPGGRQGNPLQYSCPENPHGQRNLAGYSPWGHEELDMTE